MRPRSCNSHAAKFPEFGPPAPPVAKLAQCARSRRARRLGRFGFPEIASCGTPYLFVPVRDRAPWEGRTAVTGPCDEALRNYWAQTLFVFCRDPELPGSHMRARMFAPEFGIVEDPATGSAAAALAGYLAKRGPAGTTTLKLARRTGIRDGPAQPAVRRSGQDAASGDGGARRWHGREDERRHTAATPPPE